MSGDRVIYVVDDNAGVRRSLQRDVTVDGFTVASFDSATFLSAAPRLPIGCVLLEVRNPEMDGLELQARLALLAIAHPLVIMTWQGDVPAAVQAMKAAAVDVLEKPHSGRDLLKTIESALEQKDPARGNRDAVGATQLIASLSLRERQVLNALAARAR